MHTTVGAALGALVFTAAGCTPGLIERHATEPAAELAATPFHPQVKWQCGPAALATVLGASGIDAAPETLVEQVYLPDRRGSLQLELIAASRRYGLLPYPVEPRLPALLNSVDAGRPILVLQNLGWRRRPVWHYAVVIGYDAKGDRVILRSGTDRRRRQRAHAFLRSWDRAERWGIVLLRPGEIPAGADAGRYLAALADAESAGAAELADAGFAAATTRWPADALAWLGYGNTRFRLGDRAAARAAFRRVLAMDPHNIPALNNLAHLAAADGCHDTARELIGQALAASAPGDPFHDTLADTAGEIAHNAAPDADRCPPPDH